MREILFRGKRIDNGEWYYGDLLHPDLENNTGYCIESVDKSEKNNCHEVISETVGQYTGLKDRNGKKIFEGDILSFTHKNETASGVVEMVDGCYFAIIEGHKCWIFEGVKRYKGYIIGNIHDNPELLKVGEH